MMLGYEVGFFGMIGIVLKCLIVFIVEDSFICVRIKFLFGKV